MAAGCAAGQAPGQVRLFAPDTITTAAHDELTPTFSPDGQRLVFARRLEGGRFTLHESRRVGSGWSAPAAVPFSGEWDDQAPAFSPDGTRLFFQSRRPLDPAAPRPEDAPRDDDLWVVDVAGDGWGTPRPVEPPVRRSPPPDGGEPFEGREMGPSLDRGGTLYYWSHRPGDSQGASDLYRAPATADGWAEPRSLGPPVDTAHYETHPWIAPDGSFLLFSCDGCPDAVGASDVYVSRRSGSGWSAPVNLGPGVNSEAYDFGATLSPDGRRLYVSSNRGRDGGEAGRQDIYVIAVERVPALGFLAAGSGTDGAGADSRGDGAPPGETRVEYLANEGVLISSGDRKVLIDGLFGEGLPDYPVVEPATRDSLERAIGRFGEIDAVLVTHVHRDHFDAHAVARHLAANPRARLVAPAQAVDTLRAKAGEAGLTGDRIRALRLEPGEAVEVEIGGVGIRAVGLVHPPSRNQPVELVGYRIAVGDLAVAHLGDASPTVAELEPLGRVDLLLAPWWVLTGPAGARRAEAVGARRAAAFHLGLRTTAEDVRGRLSGEMAVEVLDRPGSVPGASDPGKSPLLR